VRVVAPGVGYGTAMERKSEAARRRVGFPKRDGWKQWASIKIGTAAARGRDRSPAERGGECP
jgi:hypothetical protein